MPAIMKMTSKAQSIPGWMSLKIKMRMRMRSALRKDDMRKNNEFEDKDEENEVDNEEEYLLVGEDSGENEVEEEYKEEQEGYHVEYYLFVLRLKAVM